MKFPPLAVNLAQLGPTRIPPVTLRVQARSHRYFERVGDDLLIKVSRLARKESKLVRKESNISKRRWLDRSACF